MCSARVWWVNRCWNLGGGGKNDRTGIPSKLYEILEVPTRAGSACRLWFFCRVAFSSRNMEFEYGIWNGIFMCIVLISLVYSTVIKCCLRWEITVSLQWGLKGKVWRERLDLFWELEQLGSEALDWVRQHCLSMWGWEVFLGYLLGGTPQPSLPRQPACQVIAAFELRVCVLFARKPWCGEGACSPLSSNCLTARACCPRPSLGGRSPSGTQLCFVPC